MKWIRMTVAVGVLAGISLGCSKKDVASMPTNAPPPAEEKPIKLGGPEGGLKLKSRGGPTTNR
jgi:hypothetical protein